MKQKIEFHVTGLCSETCLNIKAGDVFVLREQSSEAAAENGETPNTSLTVFTIDGKQAGSVPDKVAGQLRRFGELQASVRSVKRDHDGAAKDILLRVQIDERGPAVLAKPYASTEEQAPTKKHEYVLDEFGYQLKRSQLEQLVHNQDLILKLGDNRLQQLLLKIDHSSNREQALAQAMTLPQFKEITDQVLTLLDEGAPPANLKVT